MYLVFFGLHFFFLIAGACRETFWAAGQGFTALPVSLEPCWRKGEWLSNAALGRTLAADDPIRQTLTAYLHAAGADGGFAFFAPAVPNSYKIVFEIHYPSGELEYDLPHVHGRAMGVRLATLLDYIGRTGYDALREVMIKMLTYPMWHSHPNANRIRAVFGFIDEPTAAEAATGAGKSYKVLYVYEFELPPDAARPPRP